MSMILFDTDLSLGTPGAEIDDGAALLMLLAAFGDAALTITTVHGNTAVHNANHNLWRLLTWLNRTGITAGAGAATGLVEEKRWFTEWQAGYGVTLPAPDLPAWPAAATLIIDTIHAAPTPPTLIAVGPLTNLALAVRLDPAIVPRVAQLVTMGGSFTADPQPEFNARCDPEAAHIVLNAGWPVRMVGLEITNQITFRRADFAALPAWNPAIALLKEQAGGWIDRVEGMGWSHDGCALHDALAVAAMMDPSLFTWQETGVAVELHDAVQRGVTRFVPVDATHPPVEAATAVDHTRCRALIERFLFPQPDLENPAKIK